MGIRNIYDYIFSCLKNRILVNKEINLRFLINKYKRLPIQIKASLWFLVCAFFQKGISFITTPVFTRLLSATEYGQYSVFNSWHSIVTVFVSLNLYFGVYAQGLVKFENERKQFISSFQGLTMTLVIVWMVIYLVLQDFWNAIFSLTTVQMLAMLIMIWTTAIFNFWSMEQRVDLKYRALVIVTILVSIAKPFLGILLVVYSEDKVTARILGLVIVEFVAYIGMFLVQMLRGRKFFYGKYWKYALVFNLPLIPHYLSSAILNSADRIMINNMINQEAAGIYNLAYNISQIMTMFNTALTQTIEPWLYKKINTKELKDISDVAYPAFIIIAVVNITLIALAPEIVRVFAPSSYYNAIWIIPPITMSVYFMFLYNFFVVFEFYFERTSFIAIATVIGAILNIVLNYFCIQKWGYFAAGYTTLVCYIVYAVSHYCFMRKICNDNFNRIQAYSTRVLVIITGIFVGVSFVFMVLYKYTVIRYLFIVISLVIIIIMRNKIIGIVKRFIGIRKVNK